MPPGGTHQHPKPLVAVSRPVGQNDAGMVAWTLTMKTPECPQGRKVRADSPIAKQTRPRTLLSLMFCILWQSIIRAGSAGALPFGLG